jgi:hypothetical protein
VITGIENGGKMKLINAGIWFRKFYQCKRFGKTEEKLLVRSKKWTENKGI